MKRFNYNHLLRKAHRYLGLCIGVQFMFWTLGGLYFSWTDIKAIRGEDVRVEPAAVPVVPGLLTGGSAPSAHLPPGASADLAKLQFVNVLDEPHYFLRFQTASGEPGSILVRLSDGNTRERAGEEQAREIAKRGLSLDLPVENVTLIEHHDVPKHHEYREQPLPAYAVTFGGPEGYTAYVSADDWQFRTVRSNSWRIFDFLWMLHTMDFEGRDDINNYLLRAFSIFGLVTILSGFALFFASSPAIRRGLRGDVG